jgi:Cu2+-exporting ATPase
MSALDASITTMTRDIPTARAAVACTHCTLDVPAGLVVRGASEQFCCNGCRTAYAVIHAGGLGRFYEMAGREGSKANRGEGDAAKGFEHFDDAAFAQLYCRSVSEGVTTATLRVEGIHCAACVWLLERLAVASPGVGPASSRVNLRQRLLTVTWDPRVTKLSAIARLCANLGYPLHPPRGLSVDAARRKESRSQLIRIGIAGAILGNVMLVTLALFAGEADVPLAMDSAMHSFFRRVSMGLSLVSLAWPGAVFFRGAWAAWRIKTPSMDVPIAIGLSLGAAWGTVNALRGTGQVYFDTICTLVFLLLVGRWIQFTQQRRAADAVEMLFALTPSTARLVEGDTVREVPVESLSSESKGCVVEVEAGGTVPVDGRVIVGDSDVDVSLLSGESRAVRVGVGDRVAAGSLNLSAPIRVEVEAAGEATRVGQLMRLVEDAAQRRAPIVRLADRLSAVFVPIVLALAAITGAVWAFIRPETAVDHAAALLITTCPCALGLATPLAVIVSIGRAAGRGILIKGGDTLEALAAKRGVMLIDKTGTLTRGGVRVVRSTCSVELLRAAAALEAGIMHPVARAIVSAASEADGTLGSEAAPRGIEITEVRNTVGRGVVGLVGGRRIVVGSARLVRETLGSLPNAVEQDVDTAASAGFSPVVAAFEGGEFGVLSLGDAVRDESRESVRRLREAGWDVRIVSGDDARIVAQVAAEVGIAPEDCLGGVSPEGKLEEVQRWRERLPNVPVVMVGDGVNDAAALSGATVGVAVHGSAEASLAAADVFLSRPGLAGLVELMEGSRRTVGVIKRNMAASLIYNAAFIALAMSGLLTPLIAAIVMPFSSLTVVLLSARGRTFDRTTAMRKGGW